MEILVWGGAAVSVGGLLGLAWCIIRVAKAKRAGLSDEELREAVKRVVPINLGALFMSVIGLMMVILGVFLG
jgi:alkylhydroperoxidase/carboxymuconolactone decarboxylase family protein YurZ